MHEKTEQIRAVMADEAFVKSCIEAENEEAVQKLFADKGIEMSLTEIELMKEMVGAVAEGKVSGEQLEKLANGGELSEDELEQAAGGGLKDFFGEYGYPDLGGITGDTPAFVLHKGRVAGAVIGGIVVVAAGAYGIAKACGVDVEGGIAKAKDGIVSGTTAAYGWVKDNITRW